MSNTTPNLGLFKYNLDTDGKESFNITQSLNNNWDKLDQNYFNINQSLINKIDKIDTLGNSTTPIYIANGRFYQCSRSIPTGSSGLTATVSLGNIGYIKFSNGFILQWGIISQGTSNANYQVNFPISFSNSNYSAFIIGGYDGSSFVYNYQWSIKERSNSSMIFRINATNHIASWLAVGY